MSPPLELVEDISITTPLPSSTDSEASIASEQSAGKSPLDKDAQEEVWRQKETYLEQIRQSVKIYGLSGHTLGLLEVLNEGKFPEVTPAAVPAAVPAPSSGLLLAIQLPDPPKFSGKEEDVDIFVGAMDERFALPGVASITEQEKVVYFSFFLTPAAARWHHSVRAKSPQLLTGYEAYANAFRDHFKDLSLIHRVFNWFKSLFRLLLSPRN